MLTGFGGKVITYDAENRSLSVALGSNLTCYVYGADGGRLKTITATCPAQTPANVADSCGALSGRLDAEAGLPLPDPGTDQARGDPAILPSGA